MYYKMEDLFQERSGRVSKSGSQTPRPRSQRSTTQDHSTSSPTCETAAQSAFCFYCYRRTFSYKPQLNTRPTACLYFSGPRETSLCDCRRKLVIHNNAPKFNGVDQWTLRRQYIIKFSSVQKFDLQFLQLLP